ncbi:MAG: dephospho-CoA kinase [Clostridia bacterium]|nr:dephospho-CoA kinase [Clostridia bacterium]
MIEQTFRIGIIGGIGSGKTAVTAILRANGANVLVADEINNELLYDKVYISRLKDIIPEAIIDGVVDRQALASIIFDDESKRQQLMRLAHPLIVELMEERSRGKLVFFEIPLINEVNMSFDRLWYIAADKDIRIERVLKRSGLTQGKVNRIIELQGEINIDLPNIVIIDNNGEYASLKRVVEELYCALLEELAL